MGTSSSSLEGRRDQERRRQGGQSSGGAGSRFATIFGGPDFAANLGPPSRPFPLPEQHRDRHPPPAEIQETVTIKNLANLQRKSLTLDVLDSAGNVQEPKFVLKFMIDCEVETQCRIYFACVEVINGSDIHFAPQNPSIPDCTVPPMTIAPGVGQMVTSPMSHPLDPTLLQEHLCWSATCPTLYPVVIEMSYVVPDTNTTQCHYTYATINKTLQKPKIHPSLQYSDPTSSNADTTSEASPSNPASNPTSTSTAVASKQYQYQVRVLKQKLQIAGNFFELEEIYGMGSEEDEQASGDECVICFTEPRTTTTMPCRHMCLCSDCADMLRRQTSKCPICRSTIERLVTIKRTKNEEEEGDDTTL